MSARTLRQRPCTQAELLRRTRQQGFSTGAQAETIVLAEPCVVGRCRLLHISAQAGVADPERELRRRSIEGGGEYTADGLYLSRLPGALVDTSRFSICPSEERYLVDSFRHPRGLTRWGYTHVQGDVYERTCEQPIEERPERVVVIGAQAHRNYSHWLLESVARALLFAPFDEGETLYLTPRLEAWQRESLLLAGVDEARILMLPRRRLVRFREVFAVSRGIARMPELIPQAVALLAALAPARRGAAGPRRLFASRALVPRRHITNELELEHMLARRGFRTVHPETLTVAEQIELFADAEAVVGAFGSNLTNLLFSPPGTLVLELAPEDLDRGGASFQRNLASIRGQHFAQIVCPVREGMRELPLGERDMTVDVAHVEGVLDGLLARSPGVRLNW